MRNVTNHSYATPKYTVVKEGSHYHVYDEWGILQLSTSSLATAVNSEAFNGLTAGRTGAQEVFVKNDAALDDTILQPNNSILTIAGDITLDAGVNAAMVTNLNTDPHNMTIRGKGRLQGNSAAQAGTSHGVYIHQTVDCALSDRNVFIEDIEVLDTLTHAVYGFDDGVTNPTIMNIKNAILRAAGAAGSGLCLHSVSDFIMTNLDCGGNDAPAVKLTGSGTGTIAGLRTDGGVQLIACRSLAISPIMLDPYNRDIRGLDMYGCQHCVIGGGIIRAASDSGFNTQDAIRVESDTGNNAWYNVLFDIYCGRISPYTSTQRWAYGIHEVESGAGDTDNNSYTGIITKDCINANVKVGASSTITGGVT